MANIKTLQMWNTICADARVSIGKSLFGLRTTATYTPTSSVIDASTLEYSPADGERLKRLLDQPADKLPASIGDFRPAPIVNGNYMAQLCTSRDGAFLAVQMLQFVNLSYVPVTGVLIFEGDAARTVKQLF